MKRFTIPIIILWLVSSIYQPLAVVIRGNSRSAKVINAGASSCYATLGIRELARVASTTGATSYGSSIAYLPTPNALLLAYVTNTKASAPNTPTFSGNGLTWVQVDTMTFNTVGSATERLTVFRAQGASPTSGTGTADFAGATQTGCIVQVVEVINADATAANGANAIVQHPTNTADTTANPTINHSAISISGTNMLISAYADSVNSTSDSTPDTGYTEISEQSYATPNTGFTLSYKLAVTSGTLTTSTATSRNWGVSLIEVKPAIITCNTAAWSLVQYSTGNNAGAAGNPTLSQITAGHTIVIWYNWENTGTITSISDATSTLSNGTRGDHGTASMHGQFFYLLNCNGGTKTFTLTTSGTLDNSSWMVAEFAYNNTASLDVQATGTGTSTALASGAVTTSGTVALAVGGYAKFSSEFVDITDGSPKINAVSVYGVPGAVPNTSPTTWMWFTPLSATFTSGTSTATLTGSREWVGNIIVFKSQ
jgi:hypothetical protein